MNIRLRHAVAASALTLVATSALAQITFYEREGFRGRALTVDRPVPNFERQGFNDRASSVVVDRGRWEVCEDADFGGRCALLKRGSYDSLRSLGLSNRISSVRPARDRVRYENEPAPLAAPTYQYRQRPGERLTEVPVESVRAVVGAANQRCWVEREQVSGGEPNVGGAIVGGIIGGVLGHQIGGGRGKDVATAGGAVAGAAIGSQAGRETYGRDVERCRTTASGPPEYWEVTYRYRGAEHRVQMSAPPGRTIWVNQQGEPRG
jgi:uncharacterized protein YcfJ